MILFLSALLTLPLSCCRRYLATDHPDYSMLAARVSVTALHKRTSPSFAATVKLLHEVPASSIGLACWYAVQSVVRCCAHQVHFRLTPPPPPLILTSLYGHHELLCKDTARVLYCDLSCTHTHTRGTHTRWPALQTRSSCNRTTQFMD
eukprot:601094-Rhodomonas_salina.1